MYLVNFEVFVSATRTTYMFRETYGCFLSRFNSPCWVRTSFLSAWQFVYLFSTVRHLRKFYWKSPQRVRKTLLKLFSGYMFLQKKEEKKQKFNSLSYRILQISFENFKEIKCLLKSRLALLALLPDHLRFKFWQNLPLSKFFFKDVLKYYETWTYLRNLRFSFILEELHFWLVLVPFRKSPFHV